MTSPHWLKISGITLAFVMVQGGLGFVAQSMLGSNVQDSLTASSQRIWQVCDPVNDLSGCRPS